MIKYCSFCGEQFETTNARQRFCKRRHFDTCEICGTSYEVPPSRLSESDRARCCSKECQQKRRAATNLTKYGGVAPAASAQVRAKMAATTLDRFGVEHAAQSKAVQEKMAATNQERYGVSWYGQSTSWKAQTNQTSMTKYGVSWPTQSTSVRDKTVRTNLSRYGVSNPMQANDVCNRFIQSHMSDGEQLSQFLSYKQDVRQFIVSLGLDHKPTMLELTALVGVNESTIGYYAHLQHCEDLIQFDVSVMEQQVSAFIADLIPGCIIQNNVHNIITPKELDIYLPEYRIAIECNPTATHNSTLPDPWGSPPKPQTYHLEKSMLCADVGIFLFHIFGSEWTHHKEIIQSMLRNLLHVDTCRIYARKCEVREVSAKDARAFLEVNHRQGNANSPIRLGLYYDDELVSLRTFGKLRRSIGTSSKEKLLDCWELVRFCSKLNTSVAGGASKLFTHFVRAYDPKQVRSFSDRAHTRGDLYAKLGFTQIRTSTPGYVWVDAQTDMSYHRYSAQKQHIAQFLRDPNIDLSKSERQIMEEHGFVQMFDCGTVLWEWTSNCLNAKPFI